MKEEFLNPFLGHVRQVWEKELGYTAEVSQAGLMTGRVTTEDISVVINVIGQLAGGVLYGFSGDTARAISSELMGEPIEELDELALSALGELANIITASASMELASVGYPCQISPPTFISGAGNSVSGMNDTQIQVLFSSGLGSLSVRVGLIEV